MLKISFSIVPPFSVATADFFGPCILMFLISLPILMGIGAAKSFIRVLSQRDPAAEAGGVTRRRTCATLALLLGSLSLAVPAAWAAPSFSVTSIDPVVFATSPGASCSADAATLQQIQLAQRHLHRLGDHHLRHR